MLAPERSWRIPLGLARGLRLEVDGCAPLHTYLGTFELELAAHIRRFARAGARCFDVGGHDAYYAMLLARLTGSHVVSFEFDASCVARMRRNLALNPALAANIRIVRTYVAHERVEYPRADTLDGLISSGELFVPDLIKLDVEGAEADVLDGASALLAGRRPDLVIETHSASLEARCLCSLTGAGYSPQIVERRRWLAEDRRSGHNRWIVAAGKERKGQGRSPAGVDNVRHDPHRYEQRPPPW
jgi:hypothetical protein